MADLITVLDVEGVIPRTIVGSFTGPVTRAKIEAAIAPYLPLPRSLFFILQNASSTWLVFFDEANDEFYFELLTRAA
jgi:hypothetical protein